MVHSCRHTGKDDPMNLEHRHLPEFRSPEFVSGVMQLPDGQPDTMIQNFNR